MMPGVQKQPSTHAYDAGRTKTAIHSCSGWLFGIYWLGELDSNPPDSVAAFGEGAVAAYHCGDAGMDVADAGHAIGGAGDDTG